MAPILIAAGAAGLAFLGYKELKKPKAGDYQSQPVLGPGGVQLKILTPIASHVTASQATGVPTPPAPSPAPHALAPAVAQVVPGQGTVYAPPKMVDVSQSGLVQLAPIVVSPTGASSVAIGSTLDVQRALNTLGFKPKLSEDGKLGPMTIANIKAFQGKHGMVVDGSAGPATKAGLSNALAGFIAGGTTAPIAAAATALVAANKVPVVTLKDIQHALNVLGTTPPLAEDGKTGPKTVAAIKSFQLTHGITVDGVAGPKTKAAISLALGAAAPPPNVSGQFAGSFG